MRKNLLLLLLVSIAITAVGQVTIPNGGFETWNSATYDYPLNYPYTSNDNAFSQSAVFNVVKTTDAHNGSGFAVKLTSLTNNPGYFLSSDPNSNKDLTKLTGGMPYDQMPTGIQGYYKYNVATGDQGLIIVTFRRAGLNIGTYIGKIGGIGEIINNYTYFKIVFDPALTQTPDAVIIGAVSSDITVHDKGISGSELFLDDISFTDVTSQPTLLNGDFQLWQQGQTPNLLDKWNSNNSQGVYRTDDHTEGSYALELTTYMGTDNNGDPKIQAAQVSTAQYDNLGNITGGGIPFAYKYGKLVFSYKYSTTGSDNPQVNLTFTKNSAPIWNSVPPPPLPTTGSYQTMEIPFSLDQIPDKVNIQIYSSSGNNPVLGSDLKIDDLHFTSLDNLSSLVWTGAIDNRWTNSNNWTPNPTNGMPSINDNVIIPQISSPNFNPVINQDPGLPLVCNNLTIKSGGLLTIDQNRALTVNGTFTNNNNASTVGLLIQSSNGFTGSLIVNGSVVQTGLTQSECLMPPNKWYIISSPLAGQSIINFLTTGTNSTVIASKNGHRGMMDYDPVGNKWNDFFTNSTDGNLETGKGYSLRVEGNSPGTAKYTGMVRVGNQNVPVTGGYWNCIGNPYTSSIWITHHNNNLDNFMDVNSTSFNTFFGGLYFWINDDNNNHGQSGQYLIVNNVPGSQNTDVQQGQAFMVCMNPGVNTVSFTPIMQHHNSGLLLKSSNVAWPSIKLLASVGGQKSSTLIAFNKAMTKGLDPTYDAGLLKGSSDLIVYSRLVEDVGIPFAIQALPDNDFSHMIIPLGLDFKTGGEVVFSSELINLPSDCKAILEDKLTKTFTDLFTNVYKTTITANSSIMDRFFLHTSTGAIDKPLSDKLTAYANRNIDIRINGQVSKNAVATLYDVHGRIVLMKNMEEGNFNIIPLPTIKTGIYMLSVKDTGKLNGFKILINQ